MFRLVVLFSLVACALAGVLQQDRIVGGEKVNIAKHPWQISLQLDEEHRCGGSIISETVIVTAAQCVEDLTSAAGLSIYAGSSELNRGGIRVDVDRFLIHPEFYRYTRNADVALLYLSSPLVYSRTVKPIVMSDARPIDRSIVTVTGWGVTVVGSDKMSSSLQGVSLYLISNRNCEWMFSNVNDNMLCAALTFERKAFCNGDSGSPLVFENTLLGVVSFGSGNCGSDGYPGVYASIPALKSWIVENM